MDGGLLLLRAAVGLTVAAHGAQKLFGWFGGPGRDGFAGFLSTLGFRRTRLYTWLAGLAEVGGGLLLATGLATPLGVAAVIGVLLSAVLLVHREKGFFNADGGYEHPLILATAAAAIGLTGPGAYALDALFELPLAEPVWAAAAIVVGVLAALAVTGMRGLEARTAGRGGARAQTA